MILRCCGIWQIALLLARDWPPIKLFLYILIFPICYNGVGGGKQHLLTRPQKGQNEIQAMAQASAWTIKASFKTH